MYDFYDTVSMNAAEEFCTRNPAFSVCQAPAPFDHEVEWNADTFADMMTETKHGFARYVTEDGDHWNLLPKSTSVGDCEDIALTIYDKLSKNPKYARSVSMGILINGDKNNGTTEGHVVVLIKANNGLWVLDSTYMKPRKLTSYMAVHWNQSKYRVYIPTDTLSKKWTPLDE